MTKKPKQRAKIVGVHATIEVPDSVAHLMVNLVLDETEPIQIPFRFTVSHINTSDGQSIVLRLMDGLNTPRGKEIWCKNIYPGYKVME